MIWGLIFVVYNIFNRIYILSMPIFLILNILALIVGGIWLITKGFWVLVLMGFILSLFVFNGYTLLMIPLDIVIFPIMDYFMAKQKKWPTLIVGTFILIINNVILLFWVLIIIYYATFAAELSETISIPFLLLGWYVAAGSITFFACKESIDNSATFLSVFLLQIAYISVALLYIFNLLWLSFPVLLFLLLLMILPAIKKMHVEWPSQYL